MYGSPTRSNKKLHCFRNFAIKSSPFSFNMGDFWELLPDIFQQIFELFRIVFSLIQPSQSQFNIYWIRWKIGNIVASNYFPYIFKQIFLHTSSPHSSFCNMEGNEGLHLEPEKSEVYFLFIVSIKIKLSYKAKKRLP